MYVLKNNVFSLNLDLMEKAILDDGVFFTILDMADFGAAEFVFSRCLNARVLKCKSATRGKFYLFTDNKSADTKFGQKT